MKPSKIKILQDYRDKAYVSNILCQKSSEFYSMLKSIMSLPLILSSSVLAILNSSDFPYGEMKIANIILNSCTALLLSLINNFKLPEKSATFRSLGIKHNKLCHYIEDLLNNDIEVNPDIIRGVIKDYDGFNEQQEYSYPHHIKEKVKKMYFGNRTLPNCLNCEIDFTKMMKSSSIDSVNNEAMQGSIVYNSRPKVLDIKIVGENECI